ncbi:MAG: SpoIIE family protein phosphatase [Phycisphaerales bacterium]|nr:SpoIIE family protein phosphatase [Planctomycetota bacterium]
MSVVVVGPILVTSIVLLVVSAVSARRAAESLVGTVMESVVVDVSEEVRDHLAGAVRLSEVYDKRFHDIGFSITDPGFWQRTIREDLVGSPAVAAVGIAQADGRAVWVHRVGKTFVAGTTEPGSRVAREFQLEGRERDALPERAYDATGRPWYVEAAASQRGIWTRIYAWFSGGNSDGTVSLGYARAERDREGKVLGAFVIDVSLENLSSFLASRPISRVGAIFLMDAEGRVVATSEGPVTLAETGKDAERPLLADYPGHYAAAAARAVAAHGHGSNLIEEVADEEPVRVRVVSLEPSAGLHWSMAVVLPESVFLSEVSAVYRRGILLALGAMVLGAVIAAVLGRRLSRPVRALSAHLVRIGEGHFNERLSLGTAREFSDAADRVNEMALSLKKRMEMERALGVATQVQQALLPGPGASLRGLDVDGRATYCDETGGDYYDFFEAKAGEDGKQTDAVLVIGDVSGHGIGAALLMATARAALRASAALGDAPAVMLTKVNGLLVESVTPGSFMTMSVLRINRQSLAVSWASAGHDPTFLCEPGEEKVQELDGADPPLGIDAATVYRSFSGRTVRPGSLLFAGTDGLWEMKNAAGQFFGKERLRRILHENCGRPAKEIAAALESELSRFRGNVSLLDDVTYWIVKVPG